MKFLYLCSALELKQYILNASATEQSSEQIVAADFYEKAIELLPDDDRIATNLGNVLQLADQPEMPCKAYEQPIDLAPQEALPQLGSGNTVRDLNQFKQADLTYARSRAIAGSTISAWTHNQLLLGLEQCKEAFTLAEPITTAALAMASIKLQSNA